MDKIPLLGTTRTHIVKHLLQGPQTAVQLAFLEGIQVSATRKHLDRLKAMGVVSERFERAGPGRPKKFYALTDEGQELFPRHYDAVLNALVAEIVRGGGEAHARRTLHRVAQGFARSAVPEPGTDRAHLRGLVAGLEGLGFEPTLSEHGNTCTITSHNCPILRTAKAHREMVCQALHSEILRSATGAPEVRRGKWIVDGDPICTHLIPTA